MPSFTKVHTSSHQNMPFFKGSSTENSHLPTITSSFKDPSTEYSHIISHKACLFNNSSLQKNHSSSHPKHVFLHAFDHKGSHILSPTPCPFSMALPHKIHISSHTNHALFQRLVHRKFTHPLTQHMSFYMSSFNETKAAYVKELPRKVNPV